MRTLKSLFAILILFFFSWNFSHAQCTTDGHSNVWNDAWISCQTSPNPNPVRGTGHWIAYEFEVANSLGEMHYWNSNETGATDKGIKDVVIDYSLDGQTWIELGTFQFDEAPGTNNYMGEAGPDFGNILARHVLITVLSTWGDASCAGIAELRFNLTPTLRAECDFTVLLEGAYNENSSVMNTIPSNLIPIQQPYSNPPYNYAGLEFLNNIPMGMVDWVLVEARRGSPNLSGTKGTYATQIKAGLLMDNGQIRDIDGNLIAFDLVPGQSYHFCIRHRNHLDFLSSESFVAQLSIINDFSAAQTEAFGSQQLTLSNNGKAMMFAGDFNQDGQIQTTDFDKWKDGPAQLNVYNFSDANLDGTVQVTDYDKWFKNRAKNGIIEIAY